MNRSFLLALLSLCLLFSAVAIWLSRENAPQTELDTQSMFPLLQENINSVSRIIVRSASGTLELEGHGQDWVAISHSGYPVKFSEVKSMLLNYAAAKRIEAKTSNPELYGKLGVQSLDDDPDSSAQHVMVKPGTGVDLVDVIVGDQVAAPVTTFYARLSDDPRSFRVEGNLEISADVAQWMETLLVDIESNRVRDIRIIRDTDPVRIYRDSREEENFKLADIPAGKKIKSQTVLDAMGSVLKEVRAESVMSASDHDFSEDSVTVEVRTFDRLLVTVTLDHKADTAYARFRFSVEPEAPAADKEAEAATEEADAGAADASKVSSDVRTEVALLNGKLGSWVYVIPYFKYDSLNRQMISLVVDENAADDSAPPSSDKS